MVKHTLVAATVILGAGDRTLNLQADDAAADDRFGQSVALSGATAIVGSVQDDDNGSASGSAYLFDTITGQQLFKLLADDGAGGDQFGQSVAISGDTVIVGARSDIDGDPNVGSAYLFDITNGQQLFKLLADDGAFNDALGIAVAISGTTAIVGAAKDDDNGIDSGSAYLFDITTGAQIAKLLADDGAADDQFGRSVAISGSMAIVGSPLDGENSGSAYLFDTTTGKQLAKLLADDGAPGDSFGNAVAISGITAIVGSPLDNDNGTDSGSAYLFDTNTGNQIAKLLPNDGAANEQFGHAVAISGQTAVIGARLDDVNGIDSGSAYLFDTANGNQIGDKLLPDDGAADDRFGWSVGISGITVIVGAPQDDGNGTDSGSAYLFDIVGHGPCAADLDGDGSVGVKDLLALLGNWGPCP